MHRIRQGRTHRVSAVAGHSAGSLSHQMELSVRPESYWTEPGNLKMEVSL